MPQTQYTSPYRNVAVILERFFNKQWLKKRDYIKNWHCMHVLVQPFVILVFNISSRNRLTPCNKDNSNTGYFFACPSANFLHSFNVLFSGFSGFYCTMVYLNLVNIMKLILSKYSEALWIKKVSVNQSSNYVNLALIYNSRLMTGALVCLLASWG